MNNLLQDIRYALRQLRRSPGFAATAILTLALGIGATTAMYTVVRSTLLAPLPYPHSEELVGISFTAPGAPPNDEQRGQTADVLLRDATSFASMGIADDGPAGQNFSNGSGSAKTLRALRVSAGYLPTLGVAPLLGHTFTRDEDLPGASPTIVLSEPLWRTALNADPGAVGRVIHINADPYTVIGVMPASFATVDSPDVWQPLHLSAADPGYEGDNFQMIARLKPGVSPARAAQELQTLTRAIYRQFPGYLKWMPPGAPKLEEFVWPLQQIVVGEARDSILALSWIVVAVLLMTCINLAGLMTSRSITRRAEVALRTSLGASRASILRLLLTESLLLALAGSVLGLVFAWIAVPLLLTSSPVPLPQLHHASVDVSAMLFAIFVAFLTVLLFGLSPAIAAVRGSLGASMSNTRAAGPGVQAQRFGKWMIVAQAALATTLLSAGALLLSAFLHMRAIPSGVRPQHLYALQVNLKGKAFAASTHSQQFVTNVADRLRQIPGVGQVAAIVGLPLDRGLNNGGGPAGHPELIRNIESRFVTPGYLSAVGMTLLAGTDISPSDTANSQPVALINRLAADRWFKGRNPVGEFVVDGGSKPRRVLGVVSDVRQNSLVDSLRPTIYLPYAQVGDETMAMINGWFSTTFVIRAVEHGQTHDPDFAAGSRAAIAAVDPGIPAAKFAPMQSFLDRSVAAPRFFSWLAGGFALFALLLTMVGLFGLLSYQVSSRTREFGVHMALGAQRRQILTLILNNGLALTAIGLVLGIVGSLTLRRIIVSLLSGTIGRDSSSAASLLASPATAIAIAAATMLLAAVAACILPAQRAASLEPTEALRTE